MDMFFSRIMDSHKRTWQTRNVLAKHIKHRMRQTQSPMAAEHCYIMDKEALHFGMRR
jgi:hypothetical protein